MYTTVDTVTAALWEYNGTRYQDEGWTRQDIETVVERVNRGARLLDEEKPGWLHDVVPEKLDMGSGQFCIIGQTYGDYDEYVGVPFGMELCAGQDAYDDALEHGFCVDGDSYPYMLLDLVWLTMLAERASNGVAIELELPPQQPRNAMIQTLVDAKQITL